MRSNIKLLVSCLIYYIDTAGKNALNLFNLPSLKMIRFKGAKILCCKVVKLHTYIHTETTMEGSICEKAKSRQKKVLNEKGKNFSQLCTWNDLKLTGCKLNYSNFFLTNFDITESTPMMLRVHNDVIRSRITNLHPDLRKHP